jgi:hypothetical protein
MPFRDRAAKAAYQKAHPEHRDFYAGARAAAWDKAHPQQANARKAKWRATHKAKQLAMQRAWRHANRGRIREFFGKKGTTPPV